MLRISTTHKFTEKFICYILCIYEWKLSRWHETERFRW